MLRVSFQRRPSLAFPAPTAAKFTLWILRSAKPSFVERVTTETPLRGYYISPDGRFLLAGGQKSNALSLYTIQTKTGKLEKAAQMKVGENPNLVEIIELPSRNSAGR